ncbi:MAG: hypothetical protein RL173_2724 [Fibrobacterota bacterium]|jgi:subtilisin family serine protease
MLMVRLTLLLLVGAIQAQAPARWLKLCGKATSAPEGSRDWENAPLRRDLLDSLRHRGWKLRNEYKWENLVSATASSGASLPACVLDVGPVAKGRVDKPLTPVAARATVTAGVDPATEALQKFWDAMGIESVRQSLLLRREAPGNGIVMAVIDGRFAPSHKVMQSVRIKDAWDFVDKSPNPWDTLNAAGYQDIHGTAVFGLIGSQWDQLPGIVPNARFLFYRAEDDASESDAEEDNLAAAIVRAVDSGAQIISTSLGYRFLSDADEVGFHDWSTFDGKTRIATRAATAAARRGVLVVVAAGNDRRLGGRSIGSPADADSVLVVGSMNLAKNASYFSSYGPTADGRPKPDVAAFGEKVPVAGFQGSDKYELQAQGTSFATPLVAGLAALALQLEPGVDAMRLLAQIKASGSLASAPDSVLGYGLPDLRRIFPDLTSVRGVMLPQYWRAASEPLVFRNSSAQGGGNLELTLISPSGRILFRRSGAYQTGNVLWAPTDGNIPRPGVMAAHWSGDYGTGSQTVLILPR